MTSPCEVHIFSNDANKAREVASQILTSAKALEKKYNFYNPDSFLSQINQRKIVKLDGQTVDLLKKSQYFYKKTDAIFDVTMGTLVDSRKNTTIERVEEEVEKMLPFVGCEHFKISRQKISFDNPYTLIDLGGVVKEFAVDMGVKILKKHKITSALLNFGGDIYALGEKPSKEPFSIGIKNPHNTSEYLVNISLANQALTTSASYERNSKIEDKTYSHIIHKKSLQEEILSATVIASTVLESGIYSTSLMINPTLKMSLKKCLIDRELQIV